MISKKEFIGNANEIFTVSKKKGLNTTQFVFSYWVRMLCIYCCCAPIACLFAINLSQRQAIIFVISLFVLMGVMFICGIILMVLDAKKVTDITNRGREFHGKKRKRNDFKR